MHRIISIAFAIYALYLIRVRKDVARNIMSYNRRIYPRGVYEEKKVETFVLVVLVILLAVSIASALGFLPHRDGPVLVHP